MSPRVDETHPEGESQPDADKQRHPARAERLVEQREIEPGDQGADRVADDLHRRRIGELTHQPAARGEVEQREDRERELHREHDLGEDQERDGVLAARRRDQEDRRHDGEKPGDQPPQPGADADVEKALHDDLAGERAGDRRRLAGGEERHRERRRGDRRAEERRQQAVRLLQLGDLEMPGAMEDRRRDDENRGVDEEGRAERDDRVRDVVPDRLPLARRRRGRCRGSGRARCAGRGCAASRWRRGCRARCRTPRRWGSSAPACRARRRPTPGCARKICRPKQSATVETRVRTIASILRKPKCIAASSSMTSKPVIRRPRRAAPRRAG